ncbi:MAG: F0F1 ATP synthase subunit B' [Rhodospirillales bacterium]
MPGIVALASAFATSPAWAAGLPQLDPSTFAPQIIWLVITFAVLYFLMARVALPRISHVLDERQHKIDGNLKKADSLKTEAEAAAEAYQESMNGARAQAHEIFRKARDEMAQESANRQEELGQRLGGEIRSAEENIGKAKDKALAAVREMTMDVTLSAVDKLAGLKLSKKEAASAVDAAIKERRL